MVCIKQLKYRQAKPDMHRFENLVQKGGRRSHARRDRVFKHIRGTCVRYDAYIPPAAKSSTAVLYSIEPPALELMPAELRTSSYLCWDYCPSWHSLFLSVSVPGLLDARSVMLL